MGKDEKTEKKPKSLARKITEWVLVVLFGAIFVIFGIGQITGMVDAKNHYGQTLRFGYAAFVVKTDSMDPVYKVDTAIVTHHDNVEDVYKRFKAGKTVDVEFFDAQCVSFKPDDTKLTDQTNYSSPTNLPMCHRLKEMHVDTSKKLGEGRYIFVVQGINDQGYMSRQAQYQAFTEKEYLGVVVASNQVVGAVFNFMTTPWGYIVIILIPTFYIVITSVLDIFKAFKDTDEDGAAVGADGTPAGAGGADISGLSEKDKERLKQELLEEMLAKRAENNNESEEK